MEQNQTNNLNLDLTVQKERFKHWLAIPSWERCPKTQQELATELDVHPVTLSKWKDDVFMIDVVKLIHRDIRKYTADVIHTVAREAIAGSCSHAKLYLEYVEKWAPNSFIYSDPRIDESIEQTRIIIEDMRRVAHEE